MPSSIGRLFATIIRGQLAFAVSIIWFTVKKAFFCSAQMDVGAKGDATLLRIASVYLGAIAIPFLIAAVPAPLIANASITVEQTQPRAANAKLRSLNRITTAQKSGVRENEGDENRPAWLKRSGSRQQERGGRRTPLGGVRQETPDTRPVWLRRSGPTWKRAPTKTAEETWKPPIPSSSATPDKPTYAALSNTPTAYELSLKQLVLLLGRSPDPTGRLAAAEALRNLGHEASPATAALQAATYDEDEGVRQAAKQALDTLRGLAQAAEKKSEKLEKPPEKVPQGKIFFLYGFHKADETGLEPLPSPLSKQEVMDLLLKGDVKLIPPALQQAMTGANTDDFFVIEQIQAMGRTSGPGFYSRALTAMFDLYYLDLAAAHAYKKEAEKRGLDTEDLTVREILLKDPQRAEQMKKHRIFNRYTRDHVVQVICNDEIKYRHLRFVDGKEHSYGGASHLGLLPGDYSAEIAIYTEEGFRLNFNVEFSVSDISKLGDMPGKLAELQQIAGPSNVSKSYRQKLAAVDPGDPDAQVQRADHSLSISFGLIDAVTDLMAFRGLKAGDLLPYIQEAVSMQNVAVLHGKENWNIEQGILVSHCVDLTTREAYTVAMEAARLAAHRANKVHPEPTSARARSVLGNLGSVYHSLASFHISYRNGVKDAHAWLERKLAVQMRLAKITGKPVDAAAERKTWPQAWWWRDAWDAYRLESLDDGQKKKKKKKKLAGKKEQETEEVKIDPRYRFDPKRTLNLLKHLIKLEKDYKRDSKWLNEITNYLGSKNIEIDKSYKELAIKRVAINKEQKDIDRLKKLMARLGEMPSNNPLEDLFQWGIKKADEIGNWWNKKKGPPPATIGEMRQRLNAEIQQSERAIANLRQEQSELIADTMRLYKNKIDELEIRARNTQFKRIKAEIKQIVKATENDRRLARMQLLFAAEGDDEFRDASRDLLKEDKFAPTVRYFEGMNFLNKQDPRRALHAFRKARMERLKAEKLIGTKIDKATELGELEHLKKARKAVRKDEEIGHWTGELFEEAVDKKLLRSAPVDYWIRQIELEYLKAIDNKAMGEAAAVRDRLRSELNKHGEPGFWGRLTDIVTSGVYTSISAIGREPEWFLVAESKLTGKSIKQLKSRKGLHETLAEHQGTILDDATKQHVGISLITRLRQKGFGLSQIRNLTTDKFVATVKEHFGWKLEREAAKRMIGNMKYALQNPDLKILESGSAQVMAVETGQKYYDPTEFDTGLKVSIPQTGIEIDVADAMNVWNVALFLGPNTLVSRPNMAQGLGQFAQQTSYSAKAQNMITLKELFARKVGLQSVANSIAQTARGREALRNFLLTHHKMGFLGRAAADASIMMAARLGAEFTGRAGAAMGQALLGRVDMTYRQVTGGDEAAISKALKSADPTIKQNRHRQEWWASAFGEAATGVTAFGIGDYDVLVSLAKTTQNNLMRQAAAKLARLRLAEAISYERQTMQMMRSHGAILESAAKPPPIKMLPPSAGRFPTSPKARMPVLPTSRNPLLLSAKRLAPVSKLKADIQRQIKQITRQIGTSDPAPSVTRRLAALNAEYQSTVAIESGMFGEAQTWNGTLSQARKNLASQIDYANTKQVAVGSLPKGSLPKTAEGSLTAASAARARPGSVVGQSLAPLEYDYGNAGVFRSGNGLMRRGAFEEARSRFSEKLVAFQKLGTQGNKMVRDAATKLQDAENAIRAARRLDLARKGPGVNRGVGQPFSGEEIGEFSRTKFKLAPTTEPLKKQAVGGKWFMEVHTGGATRPRKLHLRVGTVKGDKVFRLQEPSIYFKPRTPGKFDAEAEDLFGWTGRVGNAGSVAKTGRSKIKSPMTKLGSIEIDNQRLSGVYMKNFKGRPLYEVTAKNPAMRHALKKQLAGDMPNRMLACDGDAHGNNFKLASDAELGGFDRGDGKIIALNQEGQGWYARLKQVNQDMADLKVRLSTLPKNDAGRLPLVQRRLNLRSIRKEAKKRLLEIVQDEQVMQEVMIEHAKELWLPYRLQRGRHYWDIAEMQKRMSLSEMEEQITAITSISEKEVAAKISEYDKLSRFEKELAVKSIVTRQKRLRPATQKFLDWTQTQQLPPMPQSPVEPHKIVPPPAIRPGGIKQERRLQFDPDAR